MIFHLVVLLSLSWSHALGTEKADLHDEEAFDQVATASENVARNAEKSEQEQKDFRDQLIPSLIDTTIHYENSNGFVPMVASSSSKPDDPFRRASVSTSPTPLTNTTVWIKYPNDRNDTAKSIENNTKAESIENDPVYSTEARIFLNLPQFGTNRRSFDLQDTQNEFELLKVTNDTPAVANYQDFYEDANSPVYGNDQAATFVGSTRKSKEREKRIEDYVNNYGTYTTQSNENTPYNHRYTYDSAKDKKKSAYEPEKVASNYHRQDATMYGDHGHSATGQKGPTTSSLPRTNAEVNELTRGGTKSHQEVYDNASASLPSSKVRQTFLKPVVVAEQNQRGTDAKNVGQPSRNMDPNSQDYQTSRVIDSASAETSNRFTIYNRDGRYRNYDDSRDTSDDSADYADYTERPRRLPKNRRRPHVVENLKRLPKEHRGTMDESLEFESQGNRNNYPRMKQNRPRVKTNPWTEDGRKHQEGSYEESRYEGQLMGTETRNTGPKQISKFKTANTWNQVSPNIEISHSSGYEIDHRDKNKYLVPVKVNLVPLANFDHATALGNSQGFDVSNAVLQNLVTASSSSTVAPMLSTTATVNMLSNEEKNLQNMGVSGSVPDIIIGQNTFQNPMHAVYPQSNEHSKYQTNLRSHYVSSTGAPLFAVTSSLNPNLQSIPVQDIQGAVTPRTTYLATSSAAPNVQQLSSNQMQSNVQHLIVPQPTIQTLSNYVPVQSNSDYKIQVNPHGLHGQSLMDHGNLQVQNLATASTVTPSPQTLPVTKINLMTAESQNRKNLFSGSNANFLASASLAVGSGEQQQQQSNGNSYYLHNQNGQQIVKPQEGLYQVLKNVNFTPKGKTFLVPAVLQSVPTLTTITGNAPQLLSQQQNVQNGNFVYQSRDQPQYVNIQNNGHDNSMQNLQLQLQRDQLMKNIKLSGLGYQTIDNVGSQTSGSSNVLNSLSGAAHLPNVGTKNVEILNPNIKPSPIDTTSLNSYNTIHYPTAVLTTPIPIFSTTGFVTARPASVSTTTAESVSLQNYVDSLTEMGGKANQGVGADRPLFNPINFVPNLDLVKSQNALNGKLQASDQMPQNLNLVPLLPGGSFFKPPFVPQSDLTMKPKLNSDLEKYAEQMFKESLKTIYNSHKWNNDRKPWQNISDSADLAKLRSELQRLKASLADSQRNNDPYEAHHSETKVRTAESYDKKQSELLSALEQMLKSHSADGSHGHRGNGRPNRNRDKDKFNFGSISDFRDTKHVRDFLTPPKHHSHRSKGSFHDKPGKKRPRSGQRYNGKGHFNGPRPHSRPNNFSPKSANLEASASNVDGIRGDDFRFDNAPRDVRHRYHSDYRKESHDYLPSITTATPDDKGFHKNVYKASNGKEYDINHPRVHNLLGLLMKNKQLPSGNSQSYFRDQGQLNQYFEEDKRRQHQQFYDDTLREYLTKKSDGGRRTTSGKVTV